MTRCLCQLYGPTGRRRRCDRDATTARAGAPVCYDHREPEKAGK